MSNIVPRIGNSVSNGAEISERPGNDNAQSSFTDILADADSYQVSRLNVPARCSLPLQTCHHTSRHITVLSGVVHVTLVDDVIVLVGDESIYIPLGSLHGLENRAEEPALIISVDYIA